MSKDPAFLFYPGDYLRDTQTLSEKAQVAYDRIMCEHMRNICITQQQLNFFTKRLNNEEKEEIIFLLKKIDGGFCIEWVADSIVQRRKYSESRRKNRKGKTTKKEDNISSTYDPHMENVNAIVNEIEVKDDIVIKNKINYNEILKLFNSTCALNSIKPVLKITKDRSVKIQNLINEYKPDNAISFFDVVFNKIKSSNFLNGGGKNGFVMTFDWMLKPENFLKIVEDNYQDEKPSSKNGKQQNNNQQGGASQAYREKVLKGLTKVQPD